MSCAYDPRLTSLRQGMHHCPECGEMVMAGKAHPPTLGEVYAPIERTTYEQGRPAHDCP